MTPLLSIVIATLGRPTLERSLQSIRVQAGPIWDTEIVLVADAYEASTPDLEAICAIGREYDARVFMVDAHGHFGGHPQIQHGHEQARGRYILNLGDDDEYTPDGLALVRRAILTTPMPRPLLFRAVMKSDVTLWIDPVLKRGRISGQCIVAPNLPGKLGFWWDDYSFIAETVALHGGPDSIVWREEVIVRCH